MLRLRLGAPVQELSQKMVTLDIERAFVCEIISNRKDNQKWMVISTTGRSQSDTIPGPIPGPERRDVCEVTVDV